MAPPVGIRMARTSVIAPVAMMGFTAQTTQMTVYQVRGIIMPDTAVYSRNIHVIITTAGNTAYRIRLNMGTVRLKQNWAMENVKESVLISIHKKYLSRQ